MDEDKHPHLRLIKDPNGKDQRTTLPEPELQYYKHDPKYNYKLGMHKNNIMSLILGGLLIGFLFGFLALGVMGAIAAL